MNLKLYFKLFIDHNFFFCLVNPSSKAIEKKTLQLKSRVKTKVLQCNDACIVKLKTLQ